MAAKYTELPLAGLFLIELQSIEDSRGFFMETYKASEFERNGLDGHFVQDNQSFSGRGVLRGLHFQRSPHAQAKLVRVISGAAWDVAVDIRAASPSFGRWYGLELTPKNRNMLYIPAGFAHGFLSLVDGTELVYKCSSEYDAKSEGGVRWDDPDLGIQWPYRDVSVSQKDAALPLLKELK